MKYRFHLSAVACFALLAPVSSVAQDSSAPAAQMPTPVQLYQQVYHLIEQKFFDPTYNGQHWSRWQHRYDHQLNTLDDARKAIDTMLSSLGDRYTRYLDPSAFAGEKQAIESKLFGIGVQLDRKDNKIIVVAPVADTPAEKAGLRPKDEIIEVDGKPVAGMELAPVSNLIRGSIGTTVKLAILRDGQRLEYSIVRGEIPISSVGSVKMLNSDIGYIRLSTFMSERANLEMREALDRLSPARGIIVDLRNNPGGLVTNALDICNMFLDGGIIVSTIDRTGHVQSVGASRSPITHQPLVLLINAGSASASEIASGALHDDQRAKLVGQKTFGKGLVQSITRLDDGSGVNITIARYLTPNHTDIHKKGITPDYTVEVNPDQSLQSGPWFIYRSSGQSVPELAQLHDAQLLKAVDVLEKDIDVAASPPSLELKLNPFPNENPPESGIGIGPVR
jgi:carboxyl-terminal processing protease